MRQLLITHDMFFLSFREQLWPKSTYLNNITHIYFHCICFFRWGRKFFCSLCVASSPHWTLLLWWVYTGLGLMVEPINTEIQSSRYLHTQNGTFEKFHQLSCEATACNARQGEARWQPISLSVNS